MTEKKNLIIPPFLRRNPEKETQGYFKSAIPEGSGMDLLVGSLYKNDNAANATTASYLVQMYPKFIKYLDTRPYLNPILRDKAKEELLKGNKEVIDVISRLLVMQYEEIMRKRRSYEGQEEMHRIRENITRGRYRTKDEQKEALDTLDPEISFNKIAATNISSEMSRLIQMETGQESIAHIMDLGLVLSGKAKDILLASETTR